MVEGFWNDLLLYEVLSKELFNNELNASLLFPPFETKIEAFNSLSTISLDALLFIIVVGVFLPFFPSSFD